MRDIFCILLLLLHGGGEAYVSESQGPKFNVEPPSSVTFSNTTGTRLDCASQGSPTPRVEWHFMDGSMVTPTPGLLLLEKHSVVYPPFHGDNYRQEIHAATFRCVASNSVGTIFSTEVQVRAVVMQPYEIQVYDAYIIRGNTAVLKCDVPSFIRDYLTVISWVQDGSFNIYPSTDRVSDSKYLMLPSGELHVLNVTPADGYKNFRCRTLHKLTDETKVSATAGKIIVGDPPGPVSPRIVDKASVVIGKRGEDVVIPCVGQGNPLPVYRWHRKESDPTKLYTLEFNDKRYLIGGSLVIRNVQVEDTGSYVCAVNSSAGSGSAETELKVIFPLSAHMQPQHQVVDAGQPAEFNCITSGFPKPAMTWAKDGKRLAIDSRVQVAQNGRSLRIRPVQREDQGMYQCFVRNDMEATQATGELRLGAAKPQLIYKFIQQTLQPGPYVSLKCIATGNPTPQIKWSLDGFPLPQNDRFMIGQYVTVNGDVISHVNITSVKVEDGGTYECTAVNRVGTNTHKAYLHVYGLPYIRPMPSISAVAGEPLYITCPAAGYPIDTISWEKENRQLPVNHRQRVSKNGTLAIQNVQQKVDKGTYTCEARNRQGHAARGSVDVAIMVPPEITPFTFQDLTEGARVQVQCIVPHGDLPLTITWMKDSQPLHSSQHNNIHITDFNTYSSIFTINSVSPVHNGNYTCVARNPAREVAYTAQLKISVPPQWMLEPRDRSAILGSTISLHCQADGFPPPKIAWRRSPGKEPGTFTAIHPNRFQMEQLENGTLLIYEVREEDEGHYLCEANNGIGAGLSAVIFLTVNALPRFSVKSKKESVKRASNAVLLCEAQGDLPMQIVWRKEGEVLPLGDHDRYRIKESNLEAAMFSELTIPNVSRQDSGTYICLATNTFGQDQTTLDLLVQDVPGAPYDVRVGDLSSRIVKLTWMEPYDGNSAISKYVIRYRKESDSWNEQNPQEMVPSTQNSAIISGLHPATTYHARLSARNQLGQSDPSDTVTFTTEGEVPSGTPQDVVAMAASDGEVRVTWLPPHPDQRNGKVLGYYLGIREHSRKNKAGAYNFTTVPAAQEKQEEWLFQSLKSYTKYGFVVQAFNPKGAGPISDEVVAETLESIPSAPPQEVKCMALTSQSVQVSWEPPPEEERNGIIEGYKVFYETVEAVSGTVDTETKVTSAKTTILHGLRKHANYSIQVVSFTQVGDGVKNEPTWCITEEDVPEAPSNVKAVLSSPRSAIVSWAPPRHPNGELIKYNIYGRVLHKGKETNTLRKSIPVVHTQYEATNLEAFHTYEFWVTASTKIGEGPSTPVATLVPNQRVPAAILSFDSKHTFPWKTDVSLPCLSVGMPSPDISWTYDNRRLVTSERTRVISNGTLRIQAVQKTDAGNYTCVVRNAHGSDQVVHTIVVQVPPSSPTVTVKTIETNSVQLEWSVADDGGSPVSGYSLNYKREFGEWEEVRLGHMETSCLVKELVCGALYYFYASGYNRIGMGGASEVVTARTLGSKPVPPEDQSEFIVASVEAIAVDLQRWQDGGCPIASFSVGYRLGTDEDWKSAGSSQSPKVFTVTNLHPATNYEIRVSAENSAGSSVTVYSSRTLSAAGATSSPPVDIVAETTQQQSFFSDLRITLPIAASVVAVVLTFVTVIICWRRSMYITYTEPTRNGVNSQESQPSVTLENKQNMEQREQFYAAMHKNVPPPPVVSDTLERIPEYGDDIYPYATFQVQKNPETPSRQKAFQTFLFHDSMKRDPETMACRTLDTDEYCHVRKTKSPKRKSFRSESEEYDSLGSDSDTEHGTSSRTESSNQLEDLRGGGGGTRDKSSSSQSYTQSNIHHSRLLGLLESSTSTEPSPISERRMFLNQQRGRTSRSHSPSRRKYLASLGGLGSTEETAFTSGLDSSRELSEAECDRGIRMMRYCSRPQSEQHPHHHPLHHHHHHHHSRGSPFKAVADGRLIMQTQPAAVGTDRFHQPHLDAPVW